MKYNLIIPYFFSALLLLIFNSLSQSVSVPLSHWAYDLIERWETQGYINTVFNGSRPFTRIEMGEYIAETWKTFKRHPEWFTRTDIQQLYYLTHEFQEELKNLNLPNQNNQWESRLHTLFTKTPLKILNKVFYTNYRNLVHLKYKEFHVNADPVLSYSRHEKIDVENGKKYRLSRISNGLLFYGNLGKLIGFYFDLTDNHLSDDRWQGQKIPYEVWEESGWPYLTRRDNGNFEFDDNVAYLTLNYKYFSLLYGREYNQWGVGHTGNPLLSTNAQLYDQIKLIVRYWRFKLTHVTTFLQYISPEMRISIKSQPHIDQYWSGNRLELNLGKGIQIGLCESVVYGNRSLQLGYLNPLSFFKSIEHYNGDRDNGTLSFDFEWRIIPGVKIFGEWFIDDLTTTKLGSDWYGNKFAYQIGSFFVNPLTLKDLDILIEYTRIKPYVYSHSFQDYNKYKHYDTILGHLIGPNSDNTFLRLRKRFSKFFQIEIDFQTYRHGSNTEDRNVGGDPDRPYQYGDSPDVKFLDGVRKNQVSYGIVLHYEFIRHLFCEIHYHRSRFEPFNWESLLSFRLSFNFGYRDERMRHIFPVTY